MTEPFHFEPPVATTLPSGLRVVTARNRASASTAGGFWIGVGSADEDPAEAGITHFLEHVVFLRGSETRAPSELTRLFDEHGAVTGASTSPDATVYAAHTLADGFDMVLAALAELVQRPSLAGVELERHRILDELAGYEDDDEEALDRLFQGALYGDHPLARRPLGEPATIGSIGGADLRRWHERSYVAANAVLAVAGDVEHDRVCERAEALWVRGGERPGATRPEPPPRPPQVAFERRDIGQFLITLGARSPGEAAPEFHAVRLLVEALGGASSSRLWERLGEELGLVYAIGAEQAGTIRHGQALVTVATRSEDLGRTLAELRAELDRLAADPIEPGELRRARAIARADLLLEPRSAAEEQDRIGRRALAGLPPTSQRDELDALAAVTLDDVRAAARLLDPDSLTIAAVGPDDAAFHDALADEFGRVTSRTA